MRLSAQGASVAADSILAMLDGGALRIYTSPRPLSADAPIASAAVLLAELRFERPAFAAAVEGVARANPLTKALAQGSGRPAWFRAVRASGLPIYDGTIGMRGGDLVFPDDFISQGAEVSIAELTYTQPQE